MAGKDEVIVRDIKSQEYTIPKVSGELYRFLKVVDKHCEGAVVPNTLHPVPLPRVYIFYLYLSSLIHNPNSPYSRPHYIHIN